MRENKYKSLDCSRFAFRRLSRVPEEGRSPPVRELQLHALAYNTLLIRARRRHVRGRRRAARSGSAGLLAEARLHHSRAHRRRRFRGGLDGPVGTAPRTDGDQGGGKVVVRRRQEPHRVGLVDPQRDAVRRDVRPSVRERVPRDNRNDEKVF